LAHLKHDRIELRLDCEQGAPEFHQSTGLSKAITVLAHEPSQRVFARKYVLPVLPVLRQFEQACEGGMCHGESLRVTGPRQSPGIAQWRAARIETLRAG
jgi:hypothetical protein